MSSIYLFAVLPAALLGWALVRDFMAGLDDERAWSSEFPESPDARSTDLAA